ncbi:rhodanese-like domain-containing protein [Heyndrickxia coagulans]|uniref:rhodanese-like domain-containing protein n=1 Tax=Heyndrickxia coagulans TaxID=1398 RepID=UPI0018A7B6C4|nr:rhodanese-like domain-containing protein [Heyndrickxia coagulans]MBF8419211.1 rhodanese-like domain-containing protein [Heyndrickxia coagulans]
MSQSWYTVIIVIVAVAAYTLARYYRQKKILKSLTEEEFKAGYRKAQLIDVREPNEFANGHILGARNIPLSQLKMRLKEIRTDKPVYLYCQNGTRTGRAAEMLYKNGCLDLYQLKGGFKNWTGKIKSGK